MEREEYIELIPNTDYRDVLIELYDFFEDSFVGYYEVVSTDNGNLLVTYFSDIRKRIEEKEISNKLAELRAKTRKYDFVRPIYNSFSRNLWQFRKMNSRGIKENKEKWSKILNNAYSVTRILISAEKFYSILNGTEKASVLLILGTYDGEGTTKSLDISKSIRNEIDSIQKLSEATSDYSVLPVIKCSKHVFVKLMTDFSFMGIHVAGHGSDKRIYFSDSGMKRKHFEAEFVGQNMQFAILNCCNSYEFMKGNKITNCSNTVLHEGTLNDLLALVFSKNYYSSLFNGNNISISLNNAISVTRNEYKNIT